MNFINLFLQVPVTQKTGPAESRGKPQPEPQSSNDSDKDAALSTEPRRVKIFDGG